MLTVARPVVGTSSPAMPSPAVLVAFANGMVQWHLTSLTDAINVWGFEFGTKRMEFY